MGADFEAISSTTWAKRTNTTITAPTGITDGDLLILWHVIGSTTPPTVTPPAGWTELPVITWPQTLTDGSFKMEGRAWSKFASGEPGSYTVTHAQPTDSFGASQGAVIRCTGADIGTPFSPDPTINVHPKGSAADSSVYLGVTTTVDGTLILLLGWDWADTANNLTPPTGTTPTFTERLDTTLTYVASGVMATAGATGDKTMANNASLGDPWGAILIAVSPGSAGGGGATTPKQLAALGVG